MQCPYVLTVGPARFSRAGEATPVSSSLCVFSWFASGATTAAKGFSGEVCSQVARKSGLHPSRARAETHPAASRTNESGVAALKRLGTHLTLDVQGQGEGSQLQRHRNPPCRAGASEGLFDGDPYICNARRSVAQNRALPDEAFVRTDRQGVFGFSRWDDVGHRCGRRCPKAGSDDLRRRVFLLQSR